MPGQRRRTFSVNVGDRVLFDYDKYDLDDPTRATLQRQAAWLAKYPSVRVTVEGHCDERGTREYNLALGARRANAVKEYLVSLGVSAARLETISYGKERPVCTEFDEACWAQNRRGVTTIKSGAELLKRSLDSWQEGASDRAPFPFAPIRVLRGAAFSTKFWRSMRRSCFSARGDR